ncbi:MAG: phosphoesterase [Betaproteobacteria bacterium]|nr:alkaline phosphatase family protein [Betaproteobacteria bacterium]MBU6513231.1 alkaline phosphatase family protein [Betaproteobacteria bacterium]MDE1957097.1 phosphoesterase [Betaproteobacteria bacterium]MDE2153557.1 phosphoesterase [Betaproteobacteria bacterium]MDE2480449.1 phosphoesterase [Betaproteobacteria bacterium]
MKRKILAALVGASLLSCAAARADQGPVPAGVPHLDHVWVIMMENQPMSAEVGNPDVPYINQLYRSANVATNYYGVGHPSLTNYLEVVGGSNFGVRSDNMPDWHNASCSPNIATGVPNLDAAAPQGQPTVICPIQGSGVDAETPAIDYVNEVYPVGSGVPGNPATGSWDLDGKVGFAAAPTVGKTIAEQLMQAGKSWKSYQEDLPLAGADNVNYSDGVFVNANDSGSLLSQPTPGGSMVQLYAAKHDPFVYFRDIQEGPALHENIVGFDGPRGLYADLRSGQAPNFSFIAPNQCNDQHGRGNAGADCTGAALMYRGDAMLKKLVQAIQASPAWGHGHNAIVVTWDENDYGVNEPNKVLTLVINNHSAPRVVDNTFYSHFSLLRTLEGGMGLPCLNHACDAGTAVMSPLFAGTRDRDQDRDHDRR